MAKQTISSLPVALLLFVGCATVAHPTAGGPDHITVIGTPGGVESLLPAHAPTVTSDESFTPEQIALLAEAVVRANSMTSDTTFVAVLTEMERAQEIDWGRRKRRLLPRTALASPTRWLLDRFATEGNYRVTDIGVGDFTFPPTTAMTTACIPFNPTCALQTTLAPGYVTVDATINALANTLVHERVHSFGQAHGRRQTRRANLCDAAYIMGDLAEVLLARRDEGAPVKPRQALCGKLHRRLLARRVVK
jgi:hypothetical protein